MSTIDRNQGESSTFRGIDSRYWITCKRRATSLDSGNQIDINVRIYIEKYLIACGKRTALCIRKLEIIINTVNGHMNISPATERRKSYGFINKIKNKVI